MIVAVPLDENKSNVCVSFGRAPLFFIYNTDTGLSEIISNPAAESQGGAGIQSAQFVVDHHADTLITVRCGENAAKVFKAAGITIYKAEGAGAQYNIAALLNGKLTVLTHFHAGFHGKQ